MLGNAPTMTESKDEKSAEGWAWFTRYVLGAGLGVACAAYGTFALLVGRTYLPGLAGHDHTLSDRTGTALAGGYLAGGLFLIARLYLEKRVSAKESWANLYFAQNLLLIILIACLGYVLMNVGSAH